MGRSAAPTQETVRARTRSLPLRQRRLAWQGVCTPGSHGEALADEQDTEAAIRRFTLAHQQKTGGYRSGMLRPSVYAHPHVVLKAQGIIRINAPAAS